MDHRVAFGGPGVSPRWEHADKDGIGAGYSTANRVWFTLWRGAVTEVYYPNVDRAQVRDLQLVVTDGKSFLHCEASDFDCHVTRCNGTSQAYHVLSVAHDNGYRFEKEVIGDPDLPSLLQRYRITAKAGLRYYLICNPHLQDLAYAWASRVVSSNRRKILLAHRENRWLALGCSSSFDRASVGFAGVNDGLKDLSDNYTMDNEFTEADSGNVVLTGEVPEGVHEFTVVLAFGDAEHAALTAIEQSLAAKFDEKRDKYLKQWESSCSGRRDLRSSTDDNGRLYQISCDTLCCHEDRVYPGALIASMAIPWGK